MPLDSRISLYKLEIFDLVVDRGSVTRAAEELLVSQPVVSEHIRALEERIGARLFYRDGRSLRLTEAGRAVHAWAAGVLTDAQALSRQLDGLSDRLRGSVVVGAGMSTGSYLIPSPIARFRRERPLVDVRLEVASADQAMRETESGANDFAIVALDAEPASPRLRGELLGEEPLLIVSGPSYRLASPVAPSRLAALPFVAEPADGLPRQLVDRRLEEAGIGPRQVVIELGHPEAIKRAVHDGLGIAVLHRSAVRAELESGSLREITLRDRELSAPIWLVSRRAKLLSGVQRDLIAAIRDHVRAAMA